MLVLYQLSVCAYSGVYSATRHVSCQQFIIQCLWWTAAVVRVFLLIKTYND